MNVLHIGCFTVFTKLNIYRFYYVYLLNTHKYSLKIPRQTPGLTGDVVVQLGSTTIAIASDLCVSSIVNIVCKTQTIVVIIQSSINAITRI
jgi:hypothetical protein